MKPTLDSFLVTPTARPSLDSFVASPAPQTPPTTPNPVNDSKATFPSQQNEPVLSGAAKLIGNIPSSGLNFIKGAINFFNPINTVKTVAQIPSEFQHLVQESGGVGNALVSTAKEVLPTLYGQLVPKATQQVISGDYSGARETLTNDPVGQILPYLLVAKSAAEKAGVGSQFDSAMTKIAKPVTAPVSFAADLAKRYTTEATKFGVSQATGLSPDTITKIVSDPQAFTQEARATLDRGTLASEIKTALDTRKSTLQETGAGYQPIRNSQTPIGVGVDWLASTIKETTGLKLRGGKFVADASSQIRDPKDVRAIQNLYDTHSPVFTRGAATTNEFLNLRTDLAGLAKFEREVTKSKPLENLSAIVRGKLNTAYRSKIPGLESLDTQFGTQVSELNTLQKGLLDKSGNLTDSGISKIANAGNKEVLLSRLEEISPGITAKIKTLKAVEDIKNAGGIKVGTYARAGGLVGGIATMNPYLIVGSILSIPEVAVPILRGIGMTEPLISSTLKNLGLAGEKINNLPTSIQNTLGKNIQDIKPKLGMSVEDVSKRPENRLYPTYDSFVKAQEAKKVAGADYGDVGNIDTSQKYYKEVASKIPKNKPTNISPTVEINSKPLSSAADEAVVQKIAKETYTSPQNVRKEFRDYLIRVGEEPTIGEPTMSGFYKSKLSEINKTSSIKSGIPTTVTKSPEFQNFPRVRGLSSGDNLVQEKSIAKYINEPELVNKYIAEHGKMVNVDLARKMFTDVGYNGTNSEAVHEASSALTKDIRKEILRTSPEKAVYAYMGSSGSGKTTAANALLKPEISKAAMVLDGNMAKLSSAETFIKQVRDAGKSPRFAFVWREPIGSWKGVIDRMLNNPKEAGRVVPLSVFMENLKSLDVAKKLQSKYGKNIVEVIDNSLGAGKQNFMSQEKFNSLKYPQDLRGTLEKITKTMYDSGVVTKAQYDALIR